MSATVGGNDRARTQEIDQEGQRGFRGWPLATVHRSTARDDTKATKLTIGIVLGEDTEATDLRRWLSKDPDRHPRRYPGDGKVLAFMTEAGTKSVVMADRIIGCPHEEDIDYEGATCPACPFWAGRDRWTGKRPVLSSIAPRSTGLIKACRPVRSAWVGERETRCIECDALEVSERPERTARGYRRFRCRVCGKQFNERSGGILNRAQCPVRRHRAGGLLAPPVRLSLRDLPGDVPDPGDRIQLRSCPGLGNEADAISDR